MRKLIFILFFIPTFIIGQSCSVSIIDSNDISCFGYFDGSLELSGAGGAGSYYYSLQTYNSSFNVWTEFANSPATGSYTSYPVTFALLMADCYQIVMTDSLGCSDTASICLNEPEEIIAFSTVNQTSSSLISDGAISLDSIFGGVSPFSFSWSGPNSFSSNSQNISSLDTGLYSLIITDSASCFKSYNYYVPTLGTLGCTDPSANNYNSLATIDDGSCLYNFILNVLDSTNILCYGTNSGVIDLSGSGGTGFYNYQLQIFDSLYMSWIPIGQTPISGTYTNLPVSFTNLFDGCYKIIMTDSLLNSTSKEICLSQAEIIQITDSIIFTSSTTNTDGSIVLDSVFGGTPTYTFSWSGPNAFTSSSQNIFNLISGYYTLVVTDSNLCSQSFLYFVDFLSYGCIDPVANNYNFNANTDDGSCCYLNFYDDNIYLCLGDSVDLIYSGATVNVDSYLWSTGDTSSSLSVSPTTNTTYWLEQTTNGFTCTDTVDVIVTCLSFSPSVSISLSNYSCAISDLTINVSQDPNEIDMDSSVFISDGGSFLLSSLSIGDLVGNANLSVGTYSINTNLLVSNILSASLIEIEAVNQISGLVLGNFTVENLSSGGVKIIATSTGDGNNYTINGNSSSVTFNNLFDGPNTGVLNFTTNIYSELGDVDTQFFPFILNCVTFSPTISVFMSNDNCDSISDITLIVSQDPYEVDIDTAFFRSSSGYFLISNLSVGDTIGTASIDLVNNNFISDLLVNNVLSPTEFVVESIDQLTGSVLGTFTITNLPAGGVEIIAISPDDGNTYTSGHVSFLNFDGIFVNPPASTLQFDAEIISEVSDVFTDSFQFNISCVTFSPSVNVSLSDINCGLTNLTIGVSQDINEIDMDSAVFVADGGFFTISSMNVGDNIGLATMTLSTNSFTANLIVNSIFSSSEILVEAIDQLTGAILGTFTIINLPSGGVEIIVFSPDDGNNYTNGNSSTITFYNVYDSPNTGSVNFSSTIVSELGDVDSQNFPIALFCATFDPTISVALSDLNCSLTDLTISVSQDTNQVDMDSAVFVADGGFFTISSMNVGDNIGLATMTLSTSSFTANLIVNSILSSSEILVEAIDQLTGAILGTFTITNLPSGGVEIIAVSTDDGNNYTNGNSSTITFYNVYDSPNTGFVNFTTTIVSEFGEVNSQLIPFILNCTSFTPTVVISLSDLTCGVLADLTINVSQDTNEVDMDSALFISDGGSFSISTMNIGDTIGFASMILSVNNYITDLIVNSIISPNEILVEAIDQLTGAVLGTFTITNLPSGGIEIITASPDDGNYFTNGNISSVTFENVFLTSSSGLLTFTSTIISELGDVDSLTSGFAIGTLSSYFTIFRCDEYIWNGNLFDTSGIYVDTMSSIIGCDSIVTLNLTIYNSSTSFDTVVVCDSYLWNSIVYDSSGSYIDTILNSVGCDSVMFLELSVNNSNSYNILDICDSITWNGVLYDSSGVYNDTILNYLGCDSVITLDLTVRYLSTSIDTIVSCDSLSWNGITYDTTGYYSDTLVNAIGCDSIAYLDLTINYSSIVFDTITACDSLLWNGVVYDSTGIFTDTLLSSAGCDSIVTVYLTVNYSNSSTSSVTACDSLLWNGVIYYTSGIYDTTLTNSSGCDSLVEIYLTIVPTIYNYLYEHACGNYFFAGNNLDSSGIYYDTLTSVNSCDSIVILDLIITPRISILPLITNVDCYSNSTGQIDINVISGSSPFIYLWSNGANTSQINNLFGDSTYSCSITDSAGCTLDTILFISQPPILNVLPNVVNISCFDGNDGSITLNIFGGTTPYSIDWGSTDTNNLNYGYYNYTVIDDNGCIVFDSSLVSQPNPISIGVNLENIQCFGQSTGFIEINVLPGSGVPAYSYDWTGPILFSSTNNNIYNLFAGDYNLVITDANSCEFDTIITLTQPINLPQNTNIQTSNYSGFNIGCKGDNSGWVSVQVTGGYEPYTYLWSNFSTTDSIFNLSAGIYTLEVTDSLGCVIVFDFPLIEPAEVLSSTIFETTDYNGYNISCFGYNDGALLGIANGGVPNYTYFWNSIQSNDSITGLVAGNYELTIYDQNNCTVNSFITLIQPDSLFMDLIAYTDTCSKGVGRAEANVFGGVTPYLYTWSDGNTIPIISDFTEGNYSINVVDANECQIFDTIEIANLPSPLIDFAIYPDNQRLFDQLDDPITFVDFTNGIWQNIVQWNWDYADGSFGSDSISYHSYSDTGSFVVILTTVSEYNCIDTLSKIVTISDYNLFVPSAFTPFSTNDDLNNTFKAYGVGIKSFKMDIFDRWGGKLFFSDKLEVGWDGTKNGDRVPLGAYLYFIEAENIYGEIFKYNGQLFLME